MALPTFPQPTLVGKIQKYTPNSSSFTYYKNEDLIDETSVIN